jgi:hypothetical protein
VVPSTKLGIVPRKAKKLNIAPVLDEVEDYRRKWTQRVNRMPRNRLTRVIKIADQKEEGTREDHSRDFRICEIGTGQQVAQLNDT